MRKYKTLLSLIDIDNLDFQCLAYKYTQIVNVFERQLRSRNKRIISVQLGENEMCIRDSGSTD